jgi:hypothetical protein
MPQFSSYVKSMMHIGSVQIGLDHWEICKEMLHTFLKFQAWIRGGNNASRAESSETTASGAAE